MRQMTNEITNELLLSMDYAPKWYELQKSNRDFFYFIMESLGHIWLLYYAVLLHTAKHGWEGRIQGGDVIKTIYDTVILIERSDKTLQKFSRA